MLVLARRGGVIPFDHIRDDGSTLVQPALFESGAEWMRRIIRQSQRIRVSPWPDQPHYVEVICEAGGMVPMLGRVADPFGVTVRSGGGFDSLTAKHDLALHYVRQDKPVVVLHVGDFDPSGEAIWVNFKEDVSAFVEKDGGDLTVKRIAVTTEQRDQYNLPTSPPKKSDKRSVFPEGEQTVQVEAMPPDLLQDIVRDAIDAEVDSDALEATLKKQDYQRDYLYKALTKDSQ